MLGAEAANYARTHKTFARLKDRIDYRPQTLAWGIEERSLHTIPGNVAATINFDAIILATGATDRTLPIDGWTLPGVFTLGGAQVMLKEHGCLIGNASSFAAARRSSISQPTSIARWARRSSPSSTRRRSRQRFPRRAVSLASPGMFARGLGYMASLRRAGIAMHHGVELRAFERTQAVEAVRFRRATGKRSRCLATRSRSGSGSSPRRSLPSSGGAEFRYDPVFRQWLPHCDADGRCGESLFVAGDGATIGGAQAAAFTGTLAACAALDDLKIAVSGVDRARLRRQVARLRRFQRGLAQAFALPIDTVEKLADDVMVCRCEGVSAGDLRSAIRAQFGPTEVNRLKAITRCGMGRCQGRFCGLAAAELTAQTLGVPLETAGRLRTQPPVKPLPLAISLAESAPAAARDETNAPA